MGLTKAERKQLALAVYDSWVNDKTAIPPKPPKRLLSSAFGISHSGLYYRPTKPATDLKLKNLIEKEYELDDTLGSRKLSELLHKSRIAISRVMLKYGIEPRRKKPAYRYPGKADDVVSNKLLEAGKVDPANEILVSDILQFRLADRSWVYCCFVLRKATRQVIAFAYSWSMQATIVESNLQSIKRTDLLQDLTNTEVIFHSDQGKQYGAKGTIDEILALKFERSMSRAGTPTDNGMAERFVGTFKLAVTERYSYRNLTEFHTQAEQWLNYYNNRRPHEALRVKRHSNSKHKTKQVAPNIYAKQKGLKTIHELSLDFV